MLSVIAHRGASRAWPGNTLAAFRAAKALGADGVELDVRGTADGQLVVIHDAYLVDGRAVADLSGADVPTGVATLAAALDACGDLLVNVEIKNDPAEPGFDLGLADLVVEALDASAATVLVSSFHLPTLDRVHERRPALRTGWLVVAAPNDWPTVLADHGHHALHPHHLAVAPGLIAAAKERGFTVNTWTVDDPARMAELAALGVDGIVTNVPDIALRVLGRVYGTTRSRTSGS